MKPFEVVDDETEPTIGEEMGKAIAPAITAMSEAVDRIGRQNSAMQQMLAKSIADALMAVESKQIVVESRKIKGYKFKMKRDSNLLLSEIETTVLY